METITAAIIAARCSTVQCERDAGRLDAMQAAVRQQLVTPFAGDPRAVTAAKVVRCIAYFRSTPQARKAPLIITPRTVHDELGTWLAAGEPERWSPPPAAERGQEKYGQGHGAGRGYSLTRASTLAAEARRRDEWYEQDKATWLARHNGRLDGFE